MRVLIYCFSATGNTARVVKEYEKNLQEQGVEIVVRKISNRLENYSVDDFDMLGIAYPIHGFNAPENVLKVAEQLPSTDGKDVFIVKTSGEPLKLNDISSIRLEKILKKKGYHVANEYRYAMPYNIIFHHSNGMASLMARTMEKLAVVHCDEIMRGVESKPKHNPFDGFVAWLFRIEHKAMPLIGKRFSVDKDKCVGCGKCESVCPKGNITIEDDLPNFSKKCVGCMACAFYCPTDAVRTSILNGWRVNGEYDFDSVPEYENGKHKNYCRKAYNFYFENAEKLWEEYCKSTDASKKC